MSKSLDELVREYLSEAAGNRPADKQDGEKTGSKVAETGEQKVDGTSKDAHKDRIADRSGELPGKESATKVSDPVDKISDQTPTEVKGEKTISALKTKLSESIKPEIFEGAEYKVDLSKISGLMESQTELSEEFRTQAIEIFEAAVNDVIAEQIEAINEKAAEVVSTKIDEELASLAEQIEAIMDVQIAEWAEANALAVQQALRVQVAESFMDRMKEVFEEHYVVLPEAKTDLYEKAIEAGQEVLDLSESQAEQIADLQAEIVLLNKRMVTESFVAGMTDLKAEKIKTLAEDLEFTDAEAFTAKLSILAEGYVSKAPAKTENEDTAPITEQQETPAGYVTDADIERYTSAFNAWKR